MAQLATDRLRADQLRDIRNRHRFRSAGLDARPNGSLGVVMESRAYSYGSVGGTDHVVTSIKGCVVFDTATGAIQHVHQVVTIEGAEETTDEEVARRALGF